MSLDFPFKEQPTWAWRTIAEEQGEMLGADDADPGYDAMQVSLLRDGLAALTGRS